MCVPGIFQRSSEWTGGAPADSRAIPTGANHYSELRGIRSHTSNAIKANGQCILFLPLTDDTVLAPSITK